eukprot:2198960-Rhodomonas_salina.1
MHWQMVRQGIPQLAAKKHEEALMHAMVVEYKEHMAGADPQPDTRPPFCVALRGVGEAVWVWNAIAVR